MNLSTIFTLGATFRRLPIVSCAEAMKLAKVRAEHLHLARVYAQNHPELSTKHMRSAARLGRIIVQCAELTERNQRISLGMTEAELADY